MPKKIVRKKSPPKMLAVKKSQSKSGGQKTNKLVSADELAWEDAYRARFAASHFGTDAIGLFALALQFNLEDLDAVGAESITGGGNDKSAICSISTRRKAAV